jgi:uncharacterized protein (TIGR02302 family)
MALTRPAGQTASVRLERRVRLSRLALLWEGLWPALLAPGAVAALFLAASFFGLWSLPQARTLGLPAFALLFVASLWPLARVRPPSRRDALRRLDRLGGVADRPAAALDDRLPASADATARALWALHQERELARADALKVERPRPAVARRDPLELRVALALVLLVGAVFAGPQAYDRVAQLFRGPAAVPPIPPRVDAWLTPPAYTGRPPIFLAEGRDAEPLRVPQGSVLTVRVDRGEGVGVTVGGRALEAEQENAAAASRLFRETLQGDAAVELAQGGRVTRQWRFAVDPDRAPTIALEGQIQQAPGGALRLRYRAEDDYGVAQALVRFEGLPQPPAPAVTLALRPPLPPRPLYGAPEAPLAFPQARPRSATGQTVRDLTAHPWAGARVRVTLLARDDAGQEGFSETVTIELPQRRFAQPLARAVIEQRRSLALDAEMRERVATALDLLTLEPERRIGSARVYLGLRSAYHRLLLARNDDDLRGVVDALWEVAVLIEDGDLSAAQRALRDAQERLEQAMERGATPEELERLMQELRQALAEVMREMMQQALRDMREGRQPERPQPGERTLSQRDLEQMMREMERALREGNRDAARNMMSQLREMLDALRNGRPSMQGQNGQQQMMDELSDMIREQQRLMDRTFRERQQRQGRQQQGRQGQQGQRGQQGQQGQGQQPGEGQEGDGEGDQAMQDLQQGQGNLRDQLRRFMDQLRQGGREPGQLGEADGQMGEAQGQLGRRNPGDALGPQSRALDGLRRGAQQLSREMQGDGEGDPNGMPGGGQGQASNQRRPNMNDPLQRGLPPDETTGSDVRVPDRADRQRAQDILEEVRRRLSDPSRPAIETDYLNRLLRPF